MAGRLDVVVFDELETLLDLDPLAAQLEKVGQPGALLGPWFMRFQRDAMALTLPATRLPSSPSRARRKNLSEVADKLLTLH